MTNSLIHLVQTTWDLATYDVWGNPEDGYEVNDVYRGSIAEMSLDITRNNEGTDAEFLSAYPTDAQLREALGIDCDIDTDGDDVTIYVNRASDGYPLCEIHCTSHESLSPIRVKA